MFQELGQYLPGASFIHGLDPRTKIGGLLLFSVALLLAPDLYHALIVLLLVPFITAVARVPAGFLWRQVRPLLFFLAIVLFLQAAFTPGETILFTAGPLNFSREGVDLAGMALARVLGLVLAASLLTATTSPLRLTDGLEALLKPGQRLGLPAQELALMLSLALRFVPLLLEEAERLKLAQEARGADFGGRLGQRLQLILALVIPLLISVFRRAEDIAQAMEARCYQSGQPRSRMRPLVFSGRDALALAVLLLLVGFTLASRWV